MEPHCPCPSVMETGKSSAEKLQERPRDSTDQRGPGQSGRLSGPWLKGSPASPSPAAT